MNVHRIYRERSVFLFSVYSRADVKFFRKVCRYTYIHTSKLPRNDLLFDLQMSQWQRERERFKHLEEGECVFDSRHVHMSSSLPSLTRSTPLHDPAKPLRVIHPLSGSFLQLSARAGHAHYCCRAFCQVRCTLSSISF